MNIQSQAVPFTKGEDLSSSIGENWVRLEQLAPSKISQYANIRDIYRLWNSAATGVSARTIRPIGCPVEFDGDIVRIFLGFYVYPSEPELPFSLSSTFGTIGQEQVIEKPKEFSLFLDNTDKVELDYYMENVSIEWESPCFNEYGEEIGRPEVTFNGNNISFSKSFFGGIRVKGNAIGFYYVCTMEVSKPVTEEEVPEEEYRDQSFYEKNGVEISVSGVPDTRLNSYKISNLDCTITATWINHSLEVETEQLRLDIPQCVQDILNFCPGMFQYVLLWCTEEYSTRMVYYSTCKENTIVAVIDGTDPYKFCSRMELLNDPGPWLKSIINNQSFF